MKLLKLVIEKFSGDISLLKRLLEFEAIDRNLNLSKADKFNYLKSPFLWALLPDPPLMSRALQHCQFNLQMNNTY